MSSYTFLIDLNFKRAVLLKCDNCFVKGQWATRLTTVVILMYGSMELRCAVKTIVWFDICLYVAGIVNVSVPSARVIGCSPCILHVCFASRRGNWGDHWCAMNMSEELVIRCEVSSSRLSVGWPVNTGKASFCISVLCLVWALELILNRCSLSSNIDRLTTENGPAPNRYDISEKQFNDWFLFVTR